MKNIKNKCYIVGAGDFVCDDLPGESDLVIAADGGYDSLVKIGVTPNVLIGDMDSLDGGKTIHGVEVIRYPVKKDETDTFLAYKEGVRRGCTDFVILGGTGGREDHTYANYSLLLYAAERGHTVRLVGRESDAYVIKNEAAEFSAEAGKRISVFAIGGNAVGVSISGVLYDARNITLSPSFPIGVSNSFLKERCTVSVEDGALLIIVEKGVDKTERA